MVIGFKEGKNMEEKIELSTTEQIRLQDNALLLEANKQLKALDIKGKDYIPVNERIKAFRSIYPRGQIITEIIGLENGVCTMKASVYDNEGTLLGTGHSQEKEGSTFINKTSYIENCETSCIGRALGSCGIGLDYGFASYEEVANAKVQQEQKKLITNEQWNDLKKWYSQEEIKEMYKELNITNGKNIPEEYYRKKRQEYIEKSSNELGLNDNKEFY